MRASGLAYIYDMGLDIYWDRHRRPLENLNSILILLSVYGEKLEIAGDKAKGAVIHKAILQRATPRDIKQARDYLLLRGITHPITNAYLGNVYIDYRGYVEDRREITFRDVETGTTIGGVRVEKSLIRNSVLMAGSKIAYSLIEETRTKVTAENSFIERSLGPEFLAKGGLIYNAVVRERKKVIGMSLIGIQSKQIPGGQILLELPFDYDGQAKDKVFLTGSKGISIQRGYEQINEKIQSSAQENLQNKEHIEEGILRMPLGLSPSLSIESRQEWQTTLPMSNIDGRITTLVLQIISEIEEQQLASLHVLFEMARLRPDCNYVLIMNADTENKYRNMAESYCRGRGVSIQCVISKETQLEDFIRDNFVFLTDGTVIEPKIGPCAGRCKNQARVNSLISALGVGHSVSELDFTGGNLISTQSRLFISINDILSNTCGEPTDMAISGTKKKFEDYFTKEVIVVGRPYNELRKHISHTDTFITPLGEDRVVVGDVDLALEILSSLPEAEFDKYLANIQENIRIENSNLSACDWSLARGPMGQFFSMEERYNESLMDLRLSYRLSKDEATMNSIKEAVRNKSFTVLNMMYQVGFYLARASLYLKEVAGDLEKSGLKVTRIPFLLVSAMSCITYNNSLVEIFSEGGITKSRIYMPTYGITPLDLSAEERFGKEGFEVIKVGGLFISTVIGASALRCLTLEVRDLDPNASHKKKRVALQKLL